MTPYYRESGHFLTIGIALIISLLLHLIPLLTTWDIRFKEIETVKKKPLSVKFIQRAPRLVKPLELRKRPKVVQRMFTKLTTTRKTFRPRTMRTAAMHGGTVLASLARPSDPVDRRLSLVPEDIQLGPKLDFGEIAAEKESAVESLDDNLLSAEDLNYGRYSSFIRVNPKNKKDIKGFVKLGIFRYHTNWTDYSGDPDWNTSPRALPNLAQYMRENTGIDAQFAGIFDINDRRYIDQKIPFMFITGHHGFTWYEQEAQVLGEYLKSGGFLFIDDSDFRKGLNFDKSVRSLVLAALGPGYEFEKIPSSHPMYHVYYDFTGLPPGDDVIGTRGFAGDRPDGEHVTYNYLEGIYIDGRLAVVISNKSYNNAWNRDPHWQVGGRGGDPTRQFQLGVNLVIYALLQPGGFTQQQTGYK